MALTDLQKATRANRITATRAAKIYDGKEKDALADLLGTSQFTGNEYSRFGERNEDNIVLAVFERFGLPLETRLPISPAIPQDLRDEELDFLWASASPDAMWYNGKGELCLLECKTTGPKRYLEDWGPENGGWGSVPRYYIGQMLWQYRCTHATHLWAACNSGTYMKLIYCPLTERWQEEQRKLIAQCKELWDKHIKAPLLEKIAMSERKTV